MLLSDEKLKKIREYSGYGSFIPSQGEVEVTYIHNLLNHIEALNDLIDELKEDHAFELRMAKEDE